MSNDIKNTLLEAFGLTETILDKGGLLKALFLCGSAGSGKSTVISHLFPTLYVDYDEPHTLPEPIGHGVGKSKGYKRNPAGEVERVPVNVPSGSDIITPPPKIIDSDALFTKKLDVAGLPQKIPPEDATTPEEIELRKKQMALRDVATNKIRNVLHTMLNGYFSIIIDGTGKDPAKMVKRKQILERLGYDTYCLIVDTDLPTALRRNRKRERSLPDVGKGSVTEIWNLVQAAIPQYKQLFGENCYVANNNDGELKVAPLRKVVGGWLKSPIKNPVGQELVAQGKKGGSITRQVDPADVAVFEDNV